jgi:hypothetical protein
MDKFKQEDRKMATVVTRESVASHLAEDILRNIRTTRCCHRNQQFQPSLGQSLRVEIEVLKFAFSL